LFSVSPDLYLTRCQLGHAHASRLLAYDRVHSREICRKHFKPTKQIYSLSKYGNVIYKNRQ